MVIRSAKVIGGPDDGESARLYAGSCAYSKVLLHDFFFGRNYADSPCYCMKK